MGAALMPLSSCSSREASVLQEAATYPGHSPAAGGPFGAGGLHQVPPTSAILWSCGSGTQLGGGSS